MNSFLKKCVRFVNTVNSPVIFPPFNSMLSRPLQALSGVQPPPSPSSPQYKLIFAFDLISVSTTAMRQMVPIVHFPNETFRFRKILALKYNYVQHLISTCPPEQAETSAIFLLSPGTELISAFNLISISTTLMWHMVQLVYVTPIYESRKYFITHLFGDRTLGDITLFSVGDQLSFLRRRIFFLCEHFRHFQTKNGVLPTHDTLTSQINVGKCILRKRDLRSVNKIKPSCRTAVIFLPEVFFPFPKT